MKKTIGIDLGTNSIGWAIRDHSQSGNQIINDGVITFDKGVATEKGNEMPKVQKRTESRGKRRNYQAEKYRKFELLKFLIDKKMCPLTKAELEKWQKHRKGLKREYPQSKAFIYWLRFDFDGDGKPDFFLFNKEKYESYYIFRACSILDEFKHIFERNPQILGRVLYQLVQLRGFKGRDDEEAKTMLTGSDKNGTKGRNDIEDYIVRFKTLGAALYHYQKENGGRIRQRYNLRKDYENELKEICTIHNISNDDYQKLWKTLIWQRPLRTQKGLIGNCIYEKNKKRIAVSHPLYEEYRTWIFINNLNIEPPFQEDKIQYLNQKIYPIFLKSTPDFELEVIDKQLKKDGAKRLSNHHDKTKVLSARLLKNFQDIFGENWKEVLQWDINGNRDSQPLKRVSNFYNFEDIWHVLYTFDGRENLKSFAIEKLNLDDEKANKFSKIPLQQGYATLSSSAIKKILPYLQRGYLYSHAIYMANLYKILGEKQVTNTFTEHFADEISLILNKEAEERLQCSIVNSLITQELSSEFRYQISDDRKLDDSEMRLVLDKAIETFGVATWNFMEEYKKQEILNFVSENYRLFLKN